MEAAGSWQAADPARLIATLREHAADDALAEAGWKEVCARLDAERGSADDGLFRRAAIYAGAAGAVVAALKSNSTATLGRALHATWALCRSSAGRQIVAKAGALDAVVDAMRAHSDAPAVQEEGCAALASLMADATGATQRALVAAGGLPVLVGAMRTHAALPAVQDWACVALFYLTNGGAECVAAAQAAGARECLLSAFHARNPGEWKKLSCPGIGHAISYLGMWASPGLAARWKLTELGEAKVATVDVAGVWALAAMEALPDEEEDAL